MNNSTLTPEHLLNQWPSNLDGHLHYCIGLSGGIDSVVLLHLFKQLSLIRPLKLSAIHVNHGISTNANDWQDFCTELCANWQIPLTLAQVSVIKLGGEGLENSARKLRYAEYAKTAAEVIILAHHQDDQIETMLSQLLRGSDIHNLAAMHTQIKRREQIFWRPLLNYTKTQLITYAKLNELENITDESNYDNHYLRNFLRNKIIPELIEHDSHVLAKLMHSLHSLQKSAKLNDDLAQADFTACFSEEKHSLQRNLFVQLNELRQFNLLTWYITQQNLALPNQKRLQEFIRQINTARLDRHPELPLNSQFNLIANAKFIQIQKARLSASGLPRQVQSV
jgi:tRNA(Ile)-lysidine synthase